LGSWSNDHDNDDDDDGENDANTRRRKPTLSAYRLVTGPLL